MRKTIQHWLCIGGMFLLFSVFSISQAWAQTELSGTVNDQNGEPLIGVGVGIQGTVFGTITDQDGKFSLKTNTPPPFKLVFTMVGYSTQEMEITASKNDIAVKLEDQAVLGQEVVVGASRVAENIMKSPVTIEKMDILAIQQASTPDFYDAISRLKGVQSTSGSLTFTSYNTRGFATIANTRFVQLIDGMDNASPVLNFPTGNIVGISELDVEGVELVPGAASALYGPNAFNGILMMTSKSPFDYQGLSATAKVGITNSNTSDNLNTPHGTQPYTNVAIRYAKAFNNKFAFKVNFSMLSAKDWRANDYGNFRTTQSNYLNDNNPTYGSPDFDGVHMYGDETNIRFAGLPSASQQALMQNIAPNLTAALQAGNPTLATVPATVLNGVLLNLMPGIYQGISVNRTGFKEENMVDNTNASSIKADAALHYRINENMELSYNYRFGTGNTIYQGGERYALRNFGIQFHKLELKAKNYFVRAYTSMSDDGNSYNLSALGAFANERIAPTTTTWLPNYLANYMGELISQNPNLILGSLSGVNPATLLNSITAAQMTNAHRAARVAADRTRPALGTPEYNNLMSAVREGNFKRIREGETSPGAGFIDNSRFYHAEFNYNFAEKIKFVELQVGGNFRRYDLFTDNTIYNEIANNESEYQRIGINEFGAYVQASKSLLDDALKITASVRYDKNQNFKGQVNPRISAVYSAGANKEHNIRASFQTGFRNPDTQAQFIFFPSSTGTLLGGARANAEQYGIYEGGAVDSQGNTVNMEYVQPERLSALELGYKGVIAEKLMIDANVYYNAYKDFIVQQTVFAKEGKTTASTGAFPAGTMFRPYFNASFPISSLGAGLGLTYRLPKGYNLNGSYSYAAFNADDAPATFETQFNTPENKFNIGVSNRNIGQNIGFDVAYRWQQSYLWQSAFGVGDVPSFGVIDAQISYKLKPQKLLFKVGGTNLFGKDYVTNFAGPWVGKLYYVSITFDEFLR
jgi:outer membrane receptor protein involved in Fe transport